MRIVKRQYRQVAPEPEDSVQVTHAFPVFQDRPAIVVIGDPGAGKSTSFKALCEGDSSVSYTAIADILDIPATALHTLYDGKTLYLDGLDECRTKTEGDNVLGRIRGILLELGRPKFRLSCRSADWHGGMDMTRLQEIAPDGRLVVVHLEQLTREQIVEAVGDEVTDPTGFIDRAETYGVAPLLGNPQTLRMLVSVVKSGSWPSTRADLYHRATRLLAEEASPWHARTDQGQISTDAVLAAAGRMYAAMLIGAASGFALASDRASEQFPLLTDVLGDGPAFRGAARRRIFASEGHERIAPPHRTVAEYLAACFLVQHVRDGFPLSRVVALVTCSDGAVAPALRGLFAWMSSLCPEHAATLVARDPLGVVLYGDPSIMAHDTKMALLKALNELAETDPWFRVEDWSSIPYGGLATADMEDAFAAYIRSARKRSPAVLSCVLDAMQHGAPMPRLGNLLLKLSQDNRIADHLREDALAAFIRCCPQRKRELLDVLHRVVDGKVEDADDRLRSFILRVLYPTAIPPNAMVTYISKPSDDNIGTHPLFIIHELINATPKAELPALADAVATAPQRAEMGRSYLWGEFVEEVLLRTLQEVGEDASPARLYRWLGMALDEQGYPFSRSKRSEDIRKWLQELPDRIKDLFDVWLAEKHNTRMAGDYYVLFQYRLHQAEPPPDFAAWLLRKASSMAKEDKMAAVLFAKATDLVFFGRGTPSLTFDELWDFVENNPRFKDLFTASCRCDIPEWRWKQGAVQREREAEQKHERAETVSSLTSRLGNIRAGDDWGAMFFLGAHYFHSDDGKDQGRQPLKCVTEATTPEIAAAAADGFKNVLKKPISLTPRDIGVSAAELKGYRASHVLRAGMRLLADESPDALMTIPDNNLRLAAAFCFDSGNQDHDKPWMRVLSGKRPDLVAEALLDYARPQLEHCDRDHVTGLSILIYGEGMPDVARLVVPQLLEAYPNSKPQVLRDLLRAGLAYCAPDSILARAQAILRKKGGICETARCLWMGVVHMLAPQETAPTLTRFIGTSATKALDLLSLMGLVLQRETKIHIQLTPVCLGSTIRLCGRLFPPWKKVPSGLVSSRDEAPRLISDMIAILAGIQGAAATTTLRHLISDRGLTSWRDQLRHALHGHLRKERESGFLPPSTAEVGHALGNGRPASAADLRALVRDELRTIGEELRHGATCGYKVFWSTTTRGAVKFPKGEEECRDILVDQLRIRLGRLGLRVEPEARYAEAGRADMKVLYLSWAVPVEVKRHMNPELWTAAVEQLADRYAVDPQAQDHGVYLVLYYGSGRGIRALPPHPAGLPRPANAGQLEDALRRLLPERLRHRIDITVLDVGRPTILPRRRQR